MKLIKTADGKQKIRMTMEEWEKIGSEQGWIKESKKSKDKKDEKDENPRGQKRPKDGRGKGEGMPGGLRGGKMDKPCPTGEGPGFGQGGGRGKGKNR